MRFTRNSLLPLIILCLGSIVGYVIAKHRSKPGLVSGPQAVPSRAPKIQVSPVLHTSHFNDLEILDDGQVWAVGWDGQDPRRVWHSSDKGATWQVLTWPDNGFFYTDDIDFCDQQHGWAVGGGNSLIRTEDGGKSWQEMKVPTEVDLSMIDFLNPQIGYAAGSIGRRDRATGETHYGVKILCTSNGGETWKVCYKDDETGNIFGLEAISENVAVVSLDANSLLRTEDGGRTWRSVASALHSFLDLTFDANKVGWAVGWHGFYRSADGGNTWQQLQNLPATLSNQHWASIHFADAGNGIAVSENGAVAITTDGGETWSDAQLNLKEPFKKVRLNGNTGLILGSKNVYSLDLGVSH